VNETWIWTSGRLSLETPQTPPIFYPAPVSCFLAVILYFELTADAFDIRPPESANAVLQLGGRALASGKPGTRNYDRRHLEAVSIISNCEEPYEIGYTMYCPAHRPVNIEGKYANIFEQLCRRVENSSTEVVIIPHAAWQTDTSRISM
jgi:hypothetical protein